MAITKTTRQNKQILTSSNYYSREMDIKYMSVSQFKDFLKCEAKTMAVLNGEFEEPPNKDMLVGSYVHAALESDEAFKRFIEKNNSVIFKKNGEKYADYELADKMIETLKNDKFVMFALEGEKEKIMTAKIFGCEWKMKVDVINHEGKRFVDIKTTRNLFERHWSDKYDGWVSFVEKWDYILQMAIYRKIIEANTGELYTPYIVAVSKEKVPNKAIIHFDESRFDFEYQYIESFIERILNVKKGKITPKRCEKCDYCKSTKQLSGTIEVGELIYV